MAIDNDRQDSLSSTFAAYLSFFDNRKSIENRNQNNSKHTINFEMPKYITVAWHGLK